MDGNNGRVHMVNNTKRKKRDMPYVAPNQSTEVLRTSAGRIIDAGFIRDNPLVSRLQKIVMYLGNSIVEGGRGRGTSCLRGTSDPRVEFRLLLSMRHL